MKTLRESSGLNLNPQQDGTRIYVPIPKVTREHREKLGKAAKQKCNETKDLLRKAQNKKVSQLGQIEMEGEIFLNKFERLSFNGLLLNDVIICYLTLTCSFVCLSGEVYTKEDS